MSYLEVEFRSPHSHNLNSFIFDLSYNYHNIEFTYYRNGGKSRTSNWISKERSSAFLIVLNFSAFIVLITEHLVCYDMLYVFFYVTTASSALDSRKFAAYETLHKKPMIPQATRAPADPVLVLSSVPPRPRSSGFSWTTRPLPIAPRTPTRLR